MISSTSSCFLLFKSPSGSAFLWCIPQSRNNTPTKVPRMNRKTCKNNLICRHPKQRLIPECTSLQSSYRTALMEHWHQKLHQAHQDRSLVGARNGRVQPSPLRTENVFHGLAALAGISNLICRSQTLYPHLSCKDS